MKRITFDELHSFRDNIPEYRYFVVTGVCGPVLRYLTHFLEQSCVGRGAVSNTEIDKNFFRSLGYSEDDIYELGNSRMSSDSEVFETVTFENMYSLNLASVPRMCTLNLSAIPLEERSEWVQTMKTQNLDDSLLEKAPYGAYCVAFYNDIYDPSVKKDAKEMRKDSNIRKELKDIQQLMFSQEKQPMFAGRTRRVLWIDASVWQANRRGMYNWALDLLSDRVTEEFLWECTGACGELTMLDTLYAKLDAMSDIDARLGEGMKKKDIRQSDVYKMLLFIDGRALGWDMLRYYADKKYKGRTLKTEVAHSLQIEHNSVQQEDYLGGLGKCVKYLNLARLYIKKLFKIRCLLESGILSVTLDDKALCSRECRDVCKAYGLRRIHTEDLERAAQFDLLAFRDVCTLIEKEYVYAKTELKNDKHLTAIEGGEDVIIAPILRVYLALNNDRKRGNE